ncbi:exocyst complex component 8-like [Varroa jacobsoni]|uniref:Exocyst component Exo84 C-terminal domain-containing protein n=1 Tax=Varroa destructor TaxID=109461 RepID=A0A7M7JNU0_VARDE|nr:exocyst complex component 8-like [Varroa destructor]XP_022704086.1 exocyst complex component 8-like [Varroa jacobsoni]
MDELESTSAQKFSQLSFDPEKYVSGIVQRAGTVERILQEKQAVLNLQEQTNHQLKKNVYDNYKQFIDTAKEISYVASEMHQLRDMLHRQEQLLHAMTGLSIVQHKGGKAGIQGDLLADDGPDHVDHKRNQTAIQGDQDNHSGGPGNRKENISFLLEKVEGVARLLDGSDKTLIKAGEAILLERDDSVKVYICLLTDSLLVADLLPVKRGTIQYRLRWVFELDSLAAVDANAPSQLKMLVFPQSILLQMESLQEKVSWIEAIRAAKQQKLSRQAVANSRLAQDYPGLALALGQGEPDEEGEGTPMPDWLVDLPDDLDICIAERNFEQAVRLLQKAQDYWPTQEGDTQEISNSARDVKLRIDKRHEQLVKVLCGELSASGSGSLHGGPRAAKCAVSLLIQLGRASVAARLFLEHRATLLRSNTKSQSLHAEGALTLYVKRVCGVFFSHMAETGRQFQKAFIPHSTAIASALISWCRSQLVWFVQMLSRQLFTPQTQLSAVAEAVAICRSACHALNEIGLDFEFVLMRALRPDLQRCITDGRDKILEAIKHRASEDVWKPQKIDDTWQVSLERIGLRISVEQLYDDASMTYLTNNSIAFAKALLLFTGDTIALLDSPSHGLIASALRDVVAAHRRHIANALATTKLKSDIKFIQRNEVFLATDLAKSVERRCQQSAQACLLWLNIRSAFDDESQKF